MWCRTATTGNLGSVYDRADHIMFVMMFRRSDRVVTFLLLTLHRAWFFWVGFGWWQTFTTLFDLSLAFDIFWWSVTFYKSFEFLIRFCLIGCWDTKLITDIKLWIHLIIIIKWVTELKLRHLNLFLFPLRSPQLFLGFSIISYILHVRFWNRVEIDWTKPLCMNDLIFNLLIINWDASWQSTIHYY